MLKKLVLLVSLLVFVASGCAVFGTPPEIAVFDISPSVIMAGGSAVLVWNVVGAATVIIDQGVGIVPVAGTRVVSPMTATTYTLTAANNVGTITRSVLLAVNPPTVEAVFDVNPPVITAGGSSTLQWTVSGATAIRIEPGVGQVQSSGSLVITPDATTTYTLTATNNVSTASKSVTVVVNPPSVIATFAVTPSEIFIGQSTTLTWTSTGATNIIIEPGIGNVPPSGSRIVSPRTTTTYTLTASNACCSVSKSAVVIVDRVFPPRGLPTVLLLTIAPGTINAGDTAVLRWSVLDADSVFINNGIGFVRANGSRTVSPNTTTIFALTAANEFGVVQRSVGIIVMP